MKIRNALPQDGSLIVPLLAAFRQELCALRNPSAEPDPAAALAEWQELVEQQAPVFVCMDQGRCLGYLVCRLEEPVVWVEALYCLPDARRQGVATALFRQAESLAASYGESTLYNYIHPNNDKVIAFLDKMGYRVLNLLEVRRPYPGEPPRGALPVGDHMFEY